MQTQNLITKRVEVARTTSTNKAAALLALGCTFFQSFHKASGKKKVAVFRFFTEQRPPGTTGLVTYCFDALSNRFPKTSARSLLGEYGLAGSPHLLEGRGDACEEFDKTKKALETALFGGDMNNARREFRKLEEWLPLAVMVSIRAALENRDKLMKEWVCDLKRLPATGTIETNEAGYPRVLGAKLTAEQVDKLTNN